MKYTFVAPLAQRISTQWLLESLKATQDKTEWASNIYLVVIIPFANHSNYLGSYISPKTMAYTIDARWVLGGVVGGGLPLPDDVVRRGRINHRRRPSHGSRLNGSSIAFLPTKKPFWRTVSMDFARRILQ